jgi:hypothetical protein
MGQKEPKTPDAFSKDDFALWLIEESEGAAVILGGSLVDEELLLLLLRALRPNAGKEDNLFGPERPLGSFSSRIKLAGRLGLIDEAFVNGLNTLRDLRNQVAHGIKLSVFSSGGLSDRVASLVEWVSQNPAYEFAFKNLEKAYPNAGLRHRQFVVCIVAIVKRLRNARANAVLLQASSELSITPRAPG